MASKKPSVKFQTTQLQVIASSLKKLDDAKYRIQVGIFGDKASRPMDAQQGMTNAEVGFIHEMGSVTRNIPRRSFLLDTFTLHGQELTQELAPVVQTLFKKGRIDEYLKAASLAATNLVDKAFETGGWGAWPKDSYLTIMRKLRRTSAPMKQRRMDALKAAVGGHLGIDQTLVDSGQMAQAISARVVRA